MNASHRPKNCRHSTAWLRCSAVAAALLVLIAACATNGTDDDSPSARNAGADSAEMLDADDSVSWSAAMDEEAADSQETAAAQGIQARDSMDSDNMSDDYDDSVEAAHSMEDQSSSRDSASETATVGADLGRDIIYTATVRVEAVDVAAATAEAIKVVKSLNGITFGQQTSTREYVSTTLTFRIRPEHFEAALTGLAAVGELIDQSVNAEDVTDVVVDLNSRIKTAEISVERLRDFLSSATDTEGLADLERELAQRETNLERLRGQLRSLRDRVDLTTITLTISEAFQAVPSRALRLRAWLAAGDDDPCLGFSDLTAPPAGDVGFCFELENDGEAALTDVTLSSETLRFAMDDLVLTGGNGLERIEPGERIVATLTAEIADGRIAGRVATRGLDIDVRARAVPEDEDGTKRGSLARVVNLSLYVEEDNSPPTFVDGLRSGANALVAVGNGVLVIFGAMVPFLPVILLALAVAAWLLRRQRAAGSKSQ